MKPNQAPTTPMARGKKNHGRLTGALGGRIREYLAGEAARRYGPIDPSLAARMRRNIRRKFGVLLELDVVASQLGLYKAVYDTAATLLASYLKPAPSGPYADPANVRWDAFVTAIAKRYPREPRKRLGLVANFVIYYEYLR
jgi:hypothetical protein